MPISLLIYKQRDPVPNRKNTPPSNFHHVKYIATRPRVMKNELSNHGLFGNAATGDISVIDSLHQMQKLILQKSYERKNIHRGVISFTAETAKQLGLNSKDDFLKLVKQNIHILAEKNGIKVENLRWVAAAHNERKHPHVHIMFWDDAQTMSQSYVNPKIPNEIRKQLIKNIFAAELTAYYEEKKKATVSLRQISGEMVEEFEKVVATLNPKAFMELKELLDNEESDTYHWNGEFMSDSLIKLAKELFELKAKLPKTGRLNFQFLPPELKDEMIEFVDSLLASNEQLQSMLGLYVDSRLNLTEMYSDNMELYKKAAKDYTVNSSKNNPARFLPEKAEKIIELLIKKGRRSVAVIGEMGAGKTTAATEVVIKNLDDNLSIGIAENVHELNTSDNFRNKNVIEFQYGSNYSPTEIIEMFFRFNRDIVILGEVRNCNEAFEMIKAMLRQAKASLFTFHSSNVRRMVHDLRQLLMQTGHYTDYRETCFDVADAIDLVLHIKLDRNTGQRYVYKLSEINAHDDFTYEIRDLFVYDKEHHRYLINRDGMSREQISSCMEYEMTGADVDLLKSLFVINSGEKELYGYMEAGDRR